jgi:hypothetical protein
VSLTTKILFIAVLMLAGCGNATPDHQPEFIQRFAGVDGVSGGVYVVSGRGKTCYVLTVGVGLTTLWCEDTK